MSNKKTSSAKVEKLAVTVAEAAKQYDVSEEHILGWINSKDATKRLPAINVANTRIRPRWRIPIAELQAFMAARLNFESAPKPAPATRRSKPKRQYV